MPACRICKERIDLSVTGVRAHKCRECSKLVCRNHYDFSRNICFECAGLPIARGGTPFSFIRKSQEEQAGGSDNG